MKTLDHSMMMSLTQSLKGSKILGVSRLFYVFDNQVDREEGDLELITTVGDFVFSGANAELLRVSAGSWVDPFKSPLSEINQAYINEHGCYRKIDCSDDVRYREIIGQQISSARFLQNEAGIAGVYIHAGEAEIWFVVEGDESLVFWSKLEGYSFAD